MRIAICDDEEAQRVLIIKYLQEWATLRGHNVETSSFSSAENFLFSWDEDRQFDLLVLDIEMGVLSGMELARKIREENEERQDTISKIKRDGIEITLRNVSYCYPKETKPTLSNINLRIAPGERLALICRKCKTFCQNYWHGNFSGCHVCRGRAGFTSK